jgi:hypothetical protein
MRRACARMRVEPSSPSLPPHQPSSLRRPPAQDFYEDVFEELDKFGEVENLNVCDNIADHLVGNVYAKFRDEEDAARALTALQVGGAGDAWCQGG